MNTSPICCSRLFLAALVSTSVWIMGCGRDAGVRVYQEVRVAADEGAPAVSPHGAMPRPMPTPAPARKAALQWQTPAGWTESPGSGMRLVSFAMGEQGEGECTIVTLSGSAGGLQANVARWLGQLGLTVPQDEAFTEFLEAQERLETGSGDPVVLVNLVPFTRDQEAGPNSMMAAVATIESGTGFIKLTGPISLLEQEEENLRALCRSLQPGS